LLLDRKKIRRWAKWVALILAIVFALGFLTMGIGFGSGNFNLLSAFSCASSNTDTTEPKTSQEKLDALFKAVQANPKDTTSMLSIATVYQDMYRETDDIQNLRTAAAFLENAIDVDPTLSEVYIRVADIYLFDKFGAYDAAVKVLNKAASVTPDSPEVFQKLGTAQRNLGNKEAAAMAWQRYLQLDPNGKMAPVIREQLAAMTNTTTTTVAASTTTTAAPGTTTSVAASTTTSASTTATTAN
jgi:tetratricopeptide (TPR) repeat protein